MSIDCGDASVYHAYWAPSPSKDTWDTIGAAEYDRAAFGARIAGADE